MNSLSWFLYLIEVVSSMETYLMSLGMVSLIVILATKIILLLSALHETDMDLIKKITNIKSLIKHISFPLGLLLICILIPPKSTMYMMAASEAAEVVVNDEYSQEIIKDIQEIIKKKLEKLK